MKRKVIQLKESELKQLISRIIEEQTSSAAFGQGQQLGQVAGQQARQAVNQATTQAVGAVKQGVNTAIKGLTECVITIGKIQIKVLFYGAAVVFLIAEGIYKVGAAIGNAILKFLASTGRAVISARKAFVQSARDTVASAKLQINKGVQSFTQTLNSLKDSSVSVAKYVIDSFKQFGTQQWAKILVAAAGIKELVGVLGGYLKTAWGSIQNQIGVAWENASSWASGMYNQAKQGLQNVGNAIGNKANQIAQSASGYAGKALGAIQGFLQEMYERYLSFSDDTTSILSEAVKYNGKVIL